MTEPRPLAPPPPTAPDAFTVSELLPIRSRTTNPLKSRALLPLVLTAITCVVLFGALKRTRNYGDVDVFMNIVAVFTVLAIFVGLYLYSGERKNLIVYGVVAAITTYQLKSLWNYYYTISRHLLPWGETSNAKADFLSQLIANFCGPGLSEELLKITPALAALALAIWLRHSAESGGWLTRTFALDGPIDGMLMGMAAGAAFIVDETMVDYVPRIIKSQATVAEGYVLGFMLLIPRLLNGVIGHMAWTGVFGYFVGLAVSHPRAIVRLVLLGYVAAATLHGFWNASAVLSPDYGNYISALVTTVVFFSCFTKARQLEASRLGGPVDGHSILSLSPSPGMLPPGGIVPAPSGGVLGAVTGLATALEQSVGVSARTTIPNPGSRAVATAEPAASGLSIGAGDLRYALAPSLPIDLSALFAELGVPPGYAGRIGSGRSGELPIRNTGTQSWVVTLPNGVTIMVYPGASVVSQPGTRLVLGTGIIDIQPC